MPLTFKKRKFAEGLTAGLPPRDAALTAGYRNGRGLKVTASRLMRDKHVQAHMARARQWAHLPVGPATDDPVEYLIGVMSDPREPSVLRLEAAIAAAPYRHPRLQAVRRTAR